ncbi:MAG: endodeoxyribonuclease RusA [SAR86 cluster bacterium]|uniref:Endodeoxyribonuclease RusA n=1 Tax=SAR86 cluster bacterium TaxID=2030880 RepID=A0A2A5AXX2_9GAMM|nr:MAG: endodeoxyribonuclease RusA [SAR86 cluster bacterium]
MIIELPYPSKDLNPNGRIHWAQLARAKKGYRGDCALFTRMAIGRKTFTAPVTISITMYPPDRRRRDDDNAIASFKAGRDGVADAIKVDDADWDTTYRVEKEPLNKVVIEIKTEQETT